MQETDNKFKNVHKLKVKRWKKMFDANGNQKRARGAIII